MTDGAESSREAAHVHARLTKNDLTKRIRFESAHAFFPFFYCVYTHQENGVVVPIQYVLELIHTHPHERSWRKKNGELDFSRTARKDKNKVRGVFKYRNISEYFYYYIGITKKTVLLWKHSGWWRRKLHFFLFPFFEITAHRSLMRQEPSKVFGERMRERKWNSFEVASTAQLAQL